MKKKKVIIGIVAKHKWQASDRRDAFIRDEMKDAIFCNGAVAIGLLSPTIDVSLIDVENENIIYENLNKIITPEIEEGFVCQISLCDGIILEGGGASDAYELWVAKYCHEKDIPLLAICAGQNNMVRGLGGSVKKVENVEEHWQPEREYVHSIQIEKSSKFYELVGLETMLVNSRHIYVIDDKAGLDAVAYDDEGNIEIVEDKTKKFFIGVKFHPESLYLKDKACNAIFKGFIDICAKNKK